MSRQYFPQSRSWWRRFLLFHVLRSDKWRLNSSPDLLVIEISVEEARHIWRSASPMTPPLPILECQKASSDLTTYMWEEQANRRGWLGTHSERRVSWQTRTNMRDGAGKGDIVGDQARFGFCWAPCTKLWADPRSSWHLHGQKASSSFGNCAIQSWKALKGDKPREFLADRKAWQGCSAALQGSKHLPAPASAAGASSAQPLKPSWLY